MYFPDLSPLFKFMFWFVPVAGFLAIWKIIEIVIWLVTHVNIDWG